MAIAASPSSAAAVSIDNKMNKMINNSDEIDPEMKPDLQPQKRSGTTCHQCRQKVSAIYASCKNTAKTKPCPLKYCNKCLLNRYGENAEDMMVLDEWSCPKCRGICNCSICMKKRGHQPTGIATQMAKAGGFTSVSDMIDAKGAGNVSNYKRSKETTKLSAPVEGNIITSPKKLGKENLFDGKTDSNTDPLVSAPPEKKPKKTKKKEVKVNDIQKLQNEAEGNKTIDDQNVTQHLEKPKKIKRKRVEVIQNRTGVNDQTLTENKQKMIKCKSTIINDQNATKILEDNKCVKEVKKNTFEDVIPLPTGSELVTIAGVDLPKEDVGNALQLLEFCSTFGKILDVKKGQAEAVLRDLINGRSTRRGKYTSVVQFHVQLLSVLQEETESESESESESNVSELTNGNDSWLKALQKCISRSKLMHTYDCINATAKGYDNLDSSVKLRLLLFLCDEVLGTEKIRNWMDDQNAKFAENRKEARDKLGAAKDKEKTLKQKMQEAVDKARIENHGVPLTLKEYDELVSEIKKEADETRAEMLACKSMVSADKERPDAVRTEPIFKDNKGHLYWRLKGCSDKPGILLQDIGTGDDTVEMVDKWFEFDDEQMNLIETHINVLRSKFKKHYKN
ncbi:uncharacterized protein [Rutidosis leptorrhynchoides]|uniref:uncharacterized protein n=1 Tax=Rutidosis leptorrhynchoides TaxID=125765 RepID=UPI003A997D73